MKRHLLLFAVLLSFTQSIWAQENKEQTALNWLNENLTESKTNQGFEMLFSRPGPSGETFRYYHMVNGVEVFGSSYAIHVSNNNEVTYHSSTYDNSVETIDTTPNITAEDALSIAIDALNIEGNISQQDMKLYVYNQLDETKLVYRVTTNSEFLPGHWETIVDAKTSTVLSTRDIAIYENREVPARAINLRKESVEVPKQRNVRDICTSVVTLCESGHSRTQAFVEHAVHLHIILIIFFYLNFPTQAKRKVF